MMKIAVLRIGTKTADGYPLELWVDADPASGPPVARELLPPDLSLADPPLYDDEPVTAERTRDLFLEENEGEGLIQAGSYLYRLLHGGPVGAAWERAREEEGCSVLDIRPAALRNLPWELLYHTEKRQALFLDPKHAIVRGDLVNEPQPCEWPIRFMVVIGCSDVDDEIKWRPEVDGIEAACLHFDHRIDYLRLDQPPKEKLQGLFKRFQPHVFHFIGHGDFSNDGSNGRLWLWNGADNDFWTVDEIHLLLDDWVPHLAFLNTCRSGDQPVIDGSWAVHRPFVEHGTNAVLGMQGNVDGEAAAKFSVRVYQELARERPLYQAVSRARREVALIPRLGPLNRAWSMPSALVFVPPEQTMRIEPPLDREQQMKLAYTSQIREHCWFVNRCDERRELRERVESGEQEYRPDLLLVTGESGVGKTAFALYCLRICALRGHLLTYVDFSGRSYEALDALWEIRNGNADCALQPSLPDPAFETFDTYMHLLRPDLVAVAPPGAAAEKILGLGQEHHVAEALTAFRSGAREAALDRPLVVVLDHLGVDDDEEAKGLRESAWHDVLLPNLVRPAALGGDLFPSKLVLIVDKQRLPELGLAGLPAEKIELKLFDKKKDGELYLNQYFRYCVEEEAKRKVLVGTIFQFIQDRWSFRDVATFTQGWPLPEKIPPIIR